MGKKYKHREKSKTSLIQQPGENMVREPMMEYKSSDKNRLLPPPTEDELKQCITGDELIE